MQILPSAVSCSPSRLKVPSSTFPLLRAATTASLLRCSTPRLQHRHNPRLELLRLPGLRLKAHQDEERQSAEAQEDDDESYRGESTMPERFRYLAKEAPDPPLRWPWFVAMPFLIYAWRAVLLELSRWARPLTYVGNFFIGLLSCIGSLPRILIEAVFIFLGIISSFAGDVLSTVAGFVPPSLLSPVSVFYTTIARPAPVPEWNTITILACLVLAIGETAASTSISCQPYLLTLSGLIAIAAAKSYISELLMWTLLLGVYAFSRLVKKRDDVTSALPAAAVLAAVGGPWIRVLAVGSYTALAISHHSKSVSDQEAETETTNRDVHLPLLVAALAVGVRLVTKWAEKRHLF